MDVRQFAFLARQPSAAVKTRSSFLGLPKRGLALVLANAMFWQPLLAQADGIVVSAPGTSLGQAGNGVPIVNIAAPNGSGLSHNQFSDYNVGANGVILNNATGRTQSTQLGGIILGNPNLKGNAANVILNEVNGGSPSQLRGYTEVAGQSAHVIVANPYGITCNGCGFINTPQATLTTGKAVIENGQVSRYQVDQGSVSIEGAGLNANNIDQFEIITRSAKLNAEIQAKNLTIIAGANEVDAKTLVATARAADPATAPQLAIDSSALGGMYAGAIKLVSSEAGVGVKLDGKMAASAGDIQIAANGDLTIAQVAADGAVNLKAGNLDAQGPVYAGTVVNVQTQGNLSNHQSLAARDSITLTAGGQLTNNGIIEAGINADNTRNSTGDASLTAQIINNTGNSIIASRNLNVSATHGLNNQRGTLSARQAATLTAGTLDNQNKGRVLSTGDLNLTANQVLNTQGGLITSSGPLTATVGDLNNRGGEVSSLDLSTMTVNTLDNVAGLVTAGNALSFTSHGAVNNQGGKLTSQGTLYLNAGAVDNSGAGRIASQRALTLQVGHALVNTEGLISSEDLLSVSAASLVNRLGSLSSAGLLSVSTAGALDNQGGQLVTDDGLVLRSASLDNSQKGTVSSASTMSINTGVFDNSQGTVSTRDNLTVNAGQLTNQNNGRLTSSKALTASVSGLDQQGGTLFSETSVSLDLNQGQLNNQGGLINAPLLTLKNLKVVDNRGGEISSAQAFTLTAESLDNSDGKLLSNQALTLRITQVFNSLKGLIAAQSIDGHAAVMDNSGGTLTSRSDLLLNVDGRLSNQNSGLINAANTLTINSTGINNQNGSLLGNVIGFDFGNTAGDLNNVGGLITTTGLLTIAHLRDLNNQGGEISSSESLELAGRTLDNSQGKLISNNLLTLNGTSVINQNGLISGWQGVSVTGTDLDNRNSGTVSSRYGNAELHLSNNLLNSGSGALVSQKALTITAASLDNSDKGIVSSGGGQTFTVTSEVNNSLGGLIDSGATLELNAQTINNTAGGINAQQAITLTGASFDNTQGILTSNDSVTLDILDALTNTNGKLASGTDLLLKRAAQVNNQGGQLASQGVLTLLTGGLDNSHGGTVLANSTLTLKAIGAVQNSDDGLINSQSADLILKSASLDNAKGTIQSQTALSIDVAGTVDNQSGKIIAQAGDVTFKADTLDNRGGTLASLMGNLEVRTVGVLRNGYDLNNNRQGGTIQGKNLKLTTGSVDNYGGRMVAQTGDVVVSTGNFDNRNGGLYAKKLVNVTGADFDNSGTNDGQIAGQQINLNLSGALNNQQGIIESDSTLNITAASLKSQKGQIRALGIAGKTEFQIGGLFDNRDGTLEIANQDLDFQVGSFQNAGGTLLHVGTGTLGVTAANLSNVGGSIITRGDLTIDQDTWTNSSVIQAGRLTVKVNTLSQDASGQLLASDSFIGSGNNWTTAGLIASDGAFNLTLAGSLNGTGRASSLGNFSLSAAQLDLSNAASIAGGGITTINVSGTLSNKGRLTSASDLALNAGMLNNYGTLGSGQKLTATTGALLNDHGLVFSGGDMALHVDTLTNTSADIYSLGGIEVLGEGGVGQASRIDNLSGRIESTADMSLKSTIVTNKMDGVSNSPAHLTISSIGVRCSNCASIADGGTLANSHLVWLQTYEAPAQTSSQTVAANLTAGKNLTVVGDTFTNVNSSVSAGGTLNMTVTDFNNTASLVGGYTSLKYITMRPSIGQWGNILNYNSIYDPSYNHNIRFWNAAEQESIVGLKYPTYTGQTIASYYYYFGAKGGSGTQIPDSQYGMGASSPVPSVVANATPFSEKIIASANSSYIPAIIQAGGVVTINAKNKITNGVERSFSPITNGSGLTADTQALGTGRTTIVTLNRQLRPDLSQQQINPLSLPGFSLPTGQNGLFRLSGQVGGTTTRSGLNSWTLNGNAVATVGHLAASPSSTGTSSASVAVNHVQALPDSSGQSRPQKYLIETNPVLTDLKQFMSSDYLLSNLGYNPDTSWKRLGDGLYEQRLVEQAVVARTGQRFVDGQTSNEDQFKYLMNNAIQSKQQLNLAVGVSLTAEQVAALTHDIVWMETAEINGEKVLVPVVYLAQANNRLAPNGALIAGSDVNLIAGKDLQNVGTIRASNNLSAQADQNLVNSGLVEAGNRLDLLAGGTLTNKAGGIIAGRDVSLKTTTGDVINERTVTDYQSNYGTDTLQRGYIDTAARIEAANQLAIGAGRDFNSAGGVIKTGADTTIQAGRDINLMPAQQADSLTGGKKLRQQTITQYGTSIEVGRDFTATAGRDINSAASQIDARRDVTMVATGDLTLAPAADEQHSYSKSRRTKKQEDHVSQVATTVTAGGDVSLAAGKDMTLVASDVTAGDEAYLVAGGKLGLLSAQDSDYSLLDLKKSAPRGGKKTRRDEVTQVTNVGSEIKTGGNLTLQSGDDQQYQVAKLESGKNITLDSGGAITFDAVKDLHQESHEKSNNSLAWNSAKGHGNTDETLRQSQLIAQGNLAIKAVDGLKIDIKQIDKNTVSQTIDAMVKADPQLAWLKEAEKRGDVDWRKVQEIHDSFKYNNSGLGVGAQLVIAIVMAYFVGPMAMNALSAAGASTAVAAGGAAVATGAATNAAVSFVNNRGNLGAVIKDTTSSDALKGYMVSGITAGLAVGVFGDLTGTKFDPLTGKIKIDLTTVNGIGRFAANQILQNGTSTALSKALGMNASFNGALTTSLLNTVAAASFDAVGGQRMVDGSVDKIAVHALIGGLLAQASGSSFLAGAVAAGANEALATSLRRTLTQLDPEHRDLLLTSASQLVGLLSAALAGGDAKALEAGAWIAKNATQYNFLNHYEMVDFVGDMNACAGSDNCYRNTWTAQYGNTNYNQLSQDNLKDALGTVGPARANALLGEIHGGLAALGELQCVTAVCDAYKFTLIDRALTARAELQKVYAEGPGIIGGVLLGPIGAVGGAVRNGSTAAEAKGIEKAYAYWAGVRSEKAVPNLAKSFVPAERTGLEFEVKSVSSAEGYVNLELSARQKFNGEGNVVSSNYAQSDLVARYSPNGELYIDWYATTVTGRGVGSEMISRAIENIGPSNIKIVSARLGETNLKVFREATSSGLTKEQAVWTTPLGKTMNALGFKNVEMSGAGGGVSFSP